MNYGGHHLNVLMSKGKVPYFALASSLFRRIRDLFEENKVLEKELAVLFVGAACYSYAGESKGFLIEQTWPEKPKRDAKKVPCNIEHHRGELAVHLDGEECFGRIASRPGGHQIAVGSAHHAVSVTIS